MPKRNPWDEEYKNPILVTLGERPQEGLLKSLKFLRKKCDVSFAGLRVLDLGSGVGKNAIHLAEQGASVVAMELSPTANDIAVQRAAEHNVTVDFRLGDIGQPYLFDDASFDLVLDIMSSNALNEAGREMYLKESHRVLKPGGHLIVRGLCKDGDKNAQALLKMHPGKEHDTYYMPETRLTERIFTRDDFVATYSPYFTFLELEKNTNVAVVGDRQYKRNYWLAVLVRP